MNNLETKVMEVVDSVETLAKKIEVMRDAQRVFATFTQEQVDKIFFEAAMAANKNRISLAKMAVEETGMGVVEDKVIKNHYAAEYIYNAYKDTKTCGVIEEDKAFGIKKIAEPIGLIAAVIPTTNPTSTAIFKTLLALKTRNAIIISPHPRAKGATIEAAKIVLEAAVKAGAPENIIGWIDVPSLELTNEVMKNADILLATDPDSDRIGVVAKNGSKYEKLNGNQLGVLLLEYILKMRKYYETIPENPIIIKTIVTTSMVDRIAEEYGAKVIDTLTGFKYIGEQIGNLEKIGEVNRFVFALEESCGYLSGPYVRDKDAIGTAALICEMTEYYKRQGKTLWIQLDILYEQYGRYSSILETVEYEQFQEQNRMEKLRNKLKSENTMMYEGILITKYEDYQQGLRGLPKSNVIKMWLNNGTTIVVRPSGTEPKLKIYKEMYIGQ